MASSTSTLSGPALDFPKSATPVPFTPHINPDLIAFAKERARTYRAPLGLFPEWTLEGAPTKAMADLAKHWAEKYDWQAVEDRMNGDYKHYAITLPGNREYRADIPVHFIHHPSSNKNATPLLMLHGWTSSHLEWAELIEPLKDSFHIVAPDLPGYGFSPAPSQPGLGPRELAVAYDAIMQQLGYSTYGLVSNDLGIVVAFWMTQDVSKSIIGHFTSFLLSNPTPEDQARLEKNDVTQEEKEYINTMNAWNQMHFAYAPMHATKPLALAHSMADSPVGFAGWVWDLKHVASDGYEYAYDEIITDTLMMWFSGTYGAMRTYTEFLKPDIIALPKTDIPTGVTQWGNASGPFPYLAKYPLAPREWLDRSAKVVFFKRYEYGGHFAAHKEAKQYAADVQEFFAQL